MNHLITGGSGFLGSLIAKRLVAIGERVRTMDIRDDPQRPEIIEFVLGDVCDSSAVCSAMEGIDVVHHVAARVPLTKSGKKFAEVNVEGSRNVAVEAAKVGVQVLVHMSSSAVYGAPSETPIRTDTPTRPVEIYGKAKLQAEQVVRQVCNKNNLSLIIIRPRTILGEGRLGIFQILFEWIRDNKDVYVIGDGNQLFQFIHAHDLIDAYMLVLRAEREGIYNIGAIEFGTLREALENLIRYAGSSSRVKSLSVSFTINVLRILDILHLSPLAPWHYLTYHKPFHFDVTPLLEFGWNPKYSNDNMLKESYDWFINATEIGGADSPVSVHRKSVNQKVLRLLKYFS